MTFTDTYTDLYHDTYGTPDTVLTPPALPPAPGELLKVKVRNPELEFVGSLRYTQCDARVKHNALGTWAFDIFHDGTPDDPTLTLMQPGSGVSITYNGKVVLSGPMTAAKEDRTADGVYAIQISGTSDLQYVADRYGSPEPTKIVDDDGGQVFYDESSHFTITDTAESAIKTLVYVNLGVFATAARMSPVEVIPTAGRGSSVTISTRFDDLLETLTAAAEQGGVGLSAIQTKEGTVTFDIYVPADKTDDIKFVDNSKHVAAYSYEVQRPTGTWVAVGGGGQGVDRTFYEAGIDSDWGRIERFRDQRQTENLTEMAAEAIQFLDEQGDKFAFSCELIDSPDAPFRWAPAITETGIGSFDLGDRVSIVVRGIPIEQIVREVRISDGPSGATITPIVGTPTQSDPRDRYVRVLFDRVRDLNERLGYQERGL